MKRRRFEEDREEMNSFEGFPEQEFDTEVDEVDDEELEDKHEKS